MLKRTSLNAVDGAVRLTVQRGEEALVGDQVERRLIRLAELLGREAEIAAG